MRSPHPTTITIGRLRLGGKLLIAAGPWSVPRNTATRDLLLNIPGLDASMPSVEEFAHLSGTTIVTKTVTRHPVPVPPQATLALAPGGFVNHIGLAGVGVDHWVEDDAAALASLGIPVIVSVAADTADEFAALVSTIQACAPASLELCGFELNMSCPNVDDNVASTEHVAECMHAVRVCTDLGVLVKLPLASEPITLGRACAAMASGADAITVLNSVPAQAQHPTQAGVQFAGGYSGTALLPHALRLTAELARHGVPVVTCGGIASPRDAHDAITAGASAIQVGSLTLRDATALTSIARSLTRPNNGHRHARRFTRSSQRNAFDVMTSAVERTAAPLVIGIDPDPATLPQSVASDPEPLRAFARMVIEATRDVACAYKINVAFFEALGAHGVAQLEGVLRDVPNECLRIVDAKRADVPHTAARYAAALYDHLHADAATVVPWFGVEGVAPFCAWSDRLTIVVANSSNEGGREVQDAHTAHGTVAQSIVAQLSATYDERQLAFVGDGTSPDRIHSLRTAAPRSTLLLPGIGAQGGDATLALAAAAAPTSVPALIAVSRSLLGERPREASTASIHHNAAILHDRLLHEVIA